MRLAQAYYRQQAALGQRAAGAAARLWRGMDPVNLDASFAAILSRLLYTVSGIQLLSASSADRYVSGTLTAQGIDATADATVDPRGFAGVASDGRDLAGLLYEPVIATKTAIKSGADTGRAMTVGLTSLDMIVRTQIADAGRTAVGTSLVARPAVEGYVRMVVGRTCSRCIVLAGKFYRWNAGFDRHPRCDCIHIPSREDHSDDIRTDPDKLFASLSRKEQDKVFTKAGAQAIRDGADISQVVNVRAKGAGLSTAGGLKVTTIGGTHRGLAGQRLGAVRRGPAKARLMPESIYKEAAGDRDRALELLYRNGYLIQKPILSGAKPIAKREADALAEARAAVTRGRNRRPVGLTDQQWRAGQQALREYRGIGFTGVNSQLRNPLFEPLPQVTRRIERMDAVMAASPLRSDVIVYRGVADVRRVFGPAADGNLAGAQWAEAAYMSTSTRTQLARDFAAPGGAAAGVMEIRVARGTGAIELSALHDQAELLLQRGLRPRIVEDRGIVNGMRYLVVEIP
jgi:hypothetical protein